MHPFGSRLKDLKEACIEYIKNKIDENEGFISLPNNGELQKTNEEIYKHRKEIYKQQELEMWRNVDELNIEMLCDIADGIHFKPLENLDLEKLKNK